MSASLVNDSKMFTLLEWTQMSNYEILYDSDESPFDRITFQRVIYGRRNVMGIILTDDGDVFGSFHPTTLPCPDKESDWVNDSDYFVFKIHDDVKKYVKNEKIQSDWSLYLWNEDDDNLPSFYSVLYAFGLNAPLNHHKSGVIKRQFCGFYKSNEMLKNGEFDHFNNVYFTPSRLLLVQWDD
ncbi:TLDc domain-containing protein [Entamoeba marina]